MPRNKTLRIVVSINTHKFVCVLALFFRLTYSIPIEKYTKYLPSIWLIFYFINCEKNCVIFNIQYTILYSRDWSTTQILIFLSVNCSAFIIIILRYNVTTKIWLLIFFFLKQSEPTYLNKSAHSVVIRIIMFNEIN